MSASYFRYTTTLCMYHLHKSMLPQHICFPQVHTVALLRCTPDTVSRLLHPTVFPSLKEIHYLSGHPGIGTIHRRFSKSVSWIFPNYDYVFYNQMVEAGRGIKSDTLLSNYLSKEISDDFELYIPQYTLMNGNDYRTKLIEFMKYGQHSAELGKIDSYPLIWKPSSHHAVQHPVHLYIKKQTEDAFLKCIL